MRENDYYGHYKAFVEELKQNPEQTLQVYCREHGVVWRRLYDWMRRRILFCLCLLLLSAWLFVLQWYVTSFGNIDYKAA